MFTSARKFVPRLFLVLALLAAQTGAQVHAYTHLRATSDPTTPAQVCGECLSCAPLLAAAGPPAGIIISHCNAVHEAPRVTAVSCITRPRHYAFRSRAPPRFV